MHVRKWAAGQLQATVYACACKYIAGLTPTTGLWVSSPPVCLQQVWDMRTKKVKVELPGHADEVFAVDWSPDGSSVASGGKDKVLKLWRH